MTCQTQASIKLTTENNITYDTLWVSNITHLKAEIPFWTTNSQVKVGDYSSSYTLFNSAASIFERNNCNLANHWI